MNLNFKFRFYQVAFRRYTVWLERKYHYKSTTLWGCKWPFINPFSHSSNILDGPSHGPILHGEACSRANL